MAFASAGANKISDPEACRRRRFSLLTGEGEALTKSTNYRRKIMKRQFTITALTAWAIIALTATAFATPPIAVAGGAAQIAGVGSYAAEGECDDPEGAGSDYALVMIGSLEGCHYTFVNEYRCTPGGVYFESGTETFVGTYNGGSGTFGTTYVFTATFRNCPAFIGEIAGRCQHPIAAGTGTGVFDGVTGRLDMKDDTEAGNFPYRGHLLWGDALTSTGRLSPKDAPTVLNTSLTGGGC